MQLAAHPQSFGTSGAHCALLAWSFLPVESRASSPCWHLGVLGSLPVNLVLGEDTVSSTCSGICAGQEGISVWG